MDQESFEPLSLKLERRIQAQAIAFEGMEATIGFKPFWNWIDCEYRGQCAFQEFREKKRRIKCLYNPSIFKCPAYQYHIMPALLCENNISNS